MNTILICLIVCTIYSFIIYKILNYKLKKKIDNKTFLKEVHDEVNSLVTQINETSDRNVLLLENRFEKLNDLISVSDIALSELKKANGDLIKKKTETPKSVLDEKVEVVSDLPTKDDKKSIIENKSQIQIDEVINSDFIQSDNQSLTKKERILLLHRQGISPTVIASQTKSTIGEVELIISLNRG